MYPIFIFIFVYRPYKSNPLIPMLELEGTEEIGPRTDRIWRELSICFHSEFGKRSKTPVEGFLANHIPNNHIRKDLVRVRNRTTDRTTQLT